ncbi:MAG: DUF2142 domain-containing protein [Saprospiraceae bacterium]|nr:DUF2142 domain-containing protein [Saprospiraceae bacterium]
MALRYFVVLALLFGSFFVCIVPPFQVADEFNHFYRAWQVSDGILLGVRTADNRLGGDLPVSVAKITQVFRSLPFQPNNRIKSNIIFHNLSVPLEADKQIFVDFSNTAIYAPMAYAPQVVAISIGKFLKMPPLSIFYFARFLTLLFWLSMVYAALRLMPIKRTLFSALALLPSSLFINASASGDVLTNACSFFVIALFVKMITEKKRLPQNILLTRLGLIFFISGIISLNKLAYFPLVFLIFLIDKHHFNGLKNKLIVAFVLIFSNLAIIAFWAKTTSPQYIKFEDYDPVFRVGQQLNEGVDPFLQLAFIARHPLVFTKIAAYSLLKSLPHTVIHYVGKFGWEKNYLPIPIIVLLLLMLFIQATIKEKHARFAREKERIGGSSFGQSPKNEPTLLSFSRAKRAIDLSNYETSANLYENVEILTEPTSLSIKAKFGFLGVFILMTFSFAAAMYALWCPVGSNFIDNLGGKYFIPIYPLLLLALPTFEKSKSRVLRFLAQQNVLFAVLCVSLLWSVCQVVWRYYDF